MSGQIRYPRYRIRWSGRYDRYNPFPDKEGGGEEGGGEGGGGEEFPQLEITTLPAIAVQGGGPAVSNALLIILTPTVFTPTEESKIIQWHLDGEPIPEATGRSFRITNQPVDSVIALVVTGKKEGYQDTFAISNEIIIEAV